MTTSAATRLLQDTRYLPYLPLIYIAWADGELTDEELASIRLLAATRLAPGIDNEPVLASWLDPSEPPSATSLLRLLERIQTLAARVPEQERSTLARFGAALARVGDGELLPSVERALAELEDALGVVSAEAVSAILNDSSPAKPSPAKAPARSFDVGTMTRTLDGRDHAARNHIRDLLAEPLFRHQYPRSTARYREQVWTWLARLAEAGVGALAYPEVTGAAPDLGAFIASFEALSDFDLSLVVKTGVQFGLFGGALYFLGTARHRELLPRVATAALPGCFAMTETGHGSNVRALETTATFDQDADAWIINTPSDAGRKDYIGNAACHARVAVVFAQLHIADVSYGVHAFLVPIRGDDGQPAPGVSIEDCGEKMGLSGVDNGRLRFADVRVPRDNLLDRYASVSRRGEYSSPIPSADRRFFTMIGTLVAGRVSVACGGVAAARVALTVAIRYATRRRQFGPADGHEVPILDYQTHQLRLMPALAAAYALTFALRDLTARYLARDESTAREVETRAAALKAAATWYATATIQRCRECCGGAGYLAVNRFTALKADTDVFTTFEGDNTVLMQLAAKGLLSEYKAQLGSTRITSILRHLVARASAGVKELDPVSSRLRSAAHLRDPDVQQELLDHRYDRLLWSVADRLRRQITGGVDSFTAMNSCQQELVHLASAYAEREVLACFRSAIEGVRDPEVQRALELLRSLYALERIDDDAAWFLSAGVVEASKARAIHREVVTLCAELTPLAPRLVDAFAIPETALDAPIARRERG